MVTAAMKLNDAYSLEEKLWPISVSSVAQSCPTLGDPMNCSMPGLPVHHQLPEFTQTHSIESVMPPSHLILCRPFLFLPSIPPSIRVFSNESTRHMRWPKYWNFSFSIVPSKEIPGLQSHHFVANRWGNNGNSEILYFFELQNHCRWWLQPWN